MNTSLGLAHVWSQGDAITRGVALVLLFMSIASWIVMLGKLTAHWRYKTSTERALSQFWSAPDNAEALRVIQELDRFGAFSAMATEAITAATAYDQNATKGIGAQADKNEFIARTLQQSIVTAQTRVESGLTLPARAREPWTLLRSGVFIMRWSGSVGFGKLAWTKLQGRLARP